MLRNFAIGFGVLVMFALAAYEMSSALVIMTIFYLPSYYAYRGSMKAGPLKSPFLAFFTAFSVNAIILMLFGQPSTSNASGFAWLIAVPIFSSLFVIKAFYAFEARNVGESIPSTPREKLITLTSSPLPPVSIPTQWEVVGFRLVILCWIVSSGLLGWAWTLYGSYTKAQSDLTQVVNKYEACRTEARHAQDVCKLTDGLSFEICERRAKLYCSGEPRESLIDSYATQRDHWLETYTAFILTAEALLLVSTFGFYALRWVFLGRIRPLWLLRR